MLRYSKTSYKLDVINWDYSQRYPPAGDTEDLDATETVEEKPSPGFTGPNFQNPIEWQVDAKGEIVTHLSVSRTFKTSSLCSR